MDALPAITQLSEDFSEGRAPFDTEYLPEQDALEQVPDEFDLDLLAYGVMLDYNRNASQLWGNIIELFERDNRHFIPKYAAMIDTETLQDRFAEIGFRYPNRDAKGWIDNSQIIVDSFDGSWYNLLTRADFDAVRMKRIIEDYGFKYLKGDKLCPFFIKVVHMNVTDLERVWQLPIPVDVHIRKLSHKLIGQEVDDDEIRTYWRELGQDYDINPMTADTALWIIGNQWSSWGEEYWAEVTGQ
jgi:hypothetical protein